MFLEVVITDGRPYMISECRVRGLFANLNVRISPMLGRSDTTHRTPPNGDIPGCACGNFAYELSVL